MIYPAKSHAEVIVAAVAARDEKRAQAFAKKWSIPIVHKTYDGESNLYTAFCEPISRGNREQVLTIADLINDPALDCIYVPLPVALHYEWALKALQAGKHVLLEKPSAANADEASALFRQPLLSQPNAPVLLEARHYQFHPAWHTFLSLFDPNDVVEASARVCCPATMFPAGDIRYQYEMAGGTLMDLGTYPISALRGIFNAEPISVTSALPEFLPGSTDHRCDRAMEVTYEFPGGRVGSLKCDLSNRVEHKKGGGWWSWLFNGWPYVSGDFPGWLNVTLREKQGIEGDTQVTTQKKIVWNNFMGPHVWHRIDINTTTTYRDQDGTVLKTETSTESTKAYVWPEGQGGEVKGEDFWTVSGECTKFMRDMLTW